MEYIAENWLVDTVVGLVNHVRKENHQPVVNWYDARDIADATLRVGVALEAQNKREVEECV